MAPAPSDSCVKNFLFLRGLDLSFLFLNKVYHLFFPRKHDCRALRDVGPLFLCCVIGQSRSKDLVYNNHAFSDRGVAFVSILSG